MKNEENKFKCAAAAKLLLSTVEKLTTFASTSYSKKQQLQLKLKIENNYN